MKTMSGGPCPHYDCSNKNSFGYCLTTACINEHYQQEQWGLPSTTSKSESVVIKQQTNADRIRAMTDEELAWTYAYRLPLCHGCEASTIEDCAKCTLDWLKQGAEVECSLREDK